MGLDAFDTSEDEDSPEEIETEAIDVPEYCSIWTSEDGLMALVDVDPEYFREHVSTEIKDRAKAHNLIFLVSTGSGPKIVLTDDPEEYADQLNTRGLEEHLRERLGEVDHDFL